MAMSSGDLDGRVAIITGAAMGIGKACAMRMAQAGARVVLADIDEARGRADAERDRRLRAASRRWSGPTSRRWPTWRPSRRRAGSASATIDILVNNAAQAIGGVVDEIDEATWNRVISTNLTSVWRGMKVCVPEMTAKRQGRDRQHLVGAGVRGLQGLGGLRRRQGRHQRADPAGGGRPRAVRDPGQRGRTRHDHDAAEREGLPRASRSRGADRHAGTGRIRSAASASPRRSPSSCCSSPPTAPRSSPARSSGSTAGWSCGANEGGGDGGAAARPVARHGRGPVLPPDRARVLFDGVFTEPRLQHPEGVAVGPDGWIWCGSENGEILRIDPRRHAIEGGGDDRRLHPRPRLPRRARRCSSATRRPRCSGWTSPSRGRALRRPGIRIPNYPVVDARGAGCSCPTATLSPRLGPASGRTTSPPARASSGTAAMAFANGMALAADGAALYVCETFAQRVTRIAIEPDGRAGAADAVRRRSSRACRTGSRWTIAAICSSAATSRRACCGSRRTAGRRGLHRGPDRAPARASDQSRLQRCGLFTANLGRWHITRIDTDTSARPLWRLVAEAMPK